MPTATIYLDNAITAYRLDVMPDAGTVSTRTPAARHDVPPVFPADQAFYWTKVWQEREAAAIAELAAGQGRRYGSAEETIRSLLQVDRD